MLHSLGDAYRCGVSGVVLYKILSLWIVRYFLGVWIMSWIMLTKLCHTAAGVDMDEGCVVRVF